MTGQPPQDINKKSEDTQSSQSTQSGLGKKGLLLSILALAFVAMAVFIYSNYGSSDTAEPSTMTTASNQEDSQQANQQNKQTGEAKLEKIVVAGPMASVSNPLIRMQEQNSLADIANKIEFVQWRDPNQMRAMVLNGEVDFIAMPTNTAANLYNKGVDLKLLNVSIWGILYVVSTDKNLSDLSQLKGKEVIMPFRGDMPDIVLQRLLKERGLEVGKDVTLRYAPNPIAAMKMLMGKQADYAVLVEPAVSMALNKSQTLPAKVIAPTLYRSIDIQQEWANTFATEPRIPQAGIAVVNPNLSPEVVNRFINEYDNAMQWIKANPEPASEIIAKDIPMLEADAIAKSIEHAGMTSVSAMEAKPELIFFFEQLAILDDKLIGGKLPDDNFYYNPQ